MKSVFLSTLKRELRIGWRQRHIPRIILATTLAMTISLAAGALMWHHRSEAAVKMADEQRLQWLHRHMVNAHVAAHGGIVLIRPASLLSVLDDGDDRYLGRALFLEPHRRNLLTAAPTEGSPRFAEVALLTPAMLLQVVLPLLVILLLHAAITRERDSGTMAQTLSLGISKWQWVAGKAFGNLLPVVFVLSGFAIVFLLVVAVKSSSDLSSALWLCFAYTLYIAGFAIVSLCLSIRIRNAMMSFALLFALWIAVVFVLPRTVYVLAEHHRPSIAASDFMKELLRGDEEGMNFLDTRRKIEARLLSQYNLNDPKLLPVSSWGQTLFEREVGSSKRYNEHFDALFTTYELQQREVEWLSWFSPAVAIRTVSMSMTGTDMDHYKSFMQEAEKYRYNMVQSMNLVAVKSRMFNGSPNLQEIGVESVFPGGEEEAYRSVPEFMYKSPDWRTSLQSVAIPFLCLALWDALLLLWLLALTKKLEING